MHNDTLGKNQESAILISNFFKGNEQIFSTIINFENIKWEVSQLNLIESKLPNNLALDLHYDMAVSNDRSELSKYYKNLSSHNSILEKAKSVIPDETLNILNESLLANKKEILAYLLKTINEQEASDALNVGALNNLKKSLDLPGIEDVIPNKEGTVGLLKSLYLSLSEDGTFLGNLHLVLDIVGVLGDFAFPGLGVAADILNSIIYFVRAYEEPIPDNRANFILLGSISLIAGVLVGAGDILKVFKPVSKSMSAVLNETIKGGKAGSEAFSKVPLGEQGLVLKGLRFIAKNIVSILAKASDILGKFMSEFIAKVAGWVPFIGKPLKAFFEEIGKLFSKITAELTSFSGNFAKVEKEAIVTGVKSTNKTLNTIIKEGGTIEFDAAEGLMHIKNAKGKIISKVPTEHMTNPTLWNTKLPGFTKTISPERVAIYYNSISKTTPKLQEKIINFFTERGISAAKGTIRFTAFLGKEIIKLLSGKKDFMSTGATEAEADYFGSAELTNWIDNKIKKEKEKSGAVYVPAIILDSKDKEVFDNVTKYQNNYAKLFDQPNVIQVVYDREKNDKVEDEFKDLWKKIATGEVVSDKEGNFQKVNKSESRKYILTRNEYLKL